MSTNMRLSSSLLYLTLAPTMHAPRHRSLIILVGRGEGLG